MSDPIAHIPINLFGMPGADGSPITMNVVVMPATMHGYGTGIPYPAVMLCFVSMDGEKIPFMSIRQEDLGAFRSACDLALSKIGDESINTIDLTAPDAMEVD